MKDGDAWRGEFDMVVCDPVMWNMCIGHANFW